MEIFAKSKYFQWLKLTTLFFCLQATSAYLVITSAENGLHVLTLLLSFVIMILSVKKTQESKIAWVCALTGFVTIIAYLKMGCGIYWPQSFSIHHLLYLFGFIAVLLLLRSNMNMLRIAIYQERYNLACSLSHELMSPLTAFHLLIEQKKSGEFDAKEYQLLKNIANEIGSYIDDFIVGSLKDQSQLKLEDLNQCILSCIEKQTILQPNLEIQLHVKETVFARVDAVLLRRIIKHLRYRFVALSSFTNRSILYFSLIRRGVFFSQ